MYLFVLDYTLFLGAVHHSSSQFFFPVRAHKIKKTNHSPYLLFILVMISPILFPPPLHFFSFFHFLFASAHLLPNVPYLLYGPQFNLFVYSFLSLYSSPLSHSLFLYSVVTPLVTLVFLFSSSSMSPSFTFLSSNSSVDYEMPCFSSQKSNAVALIMRPLCWSS